MLPVGMTIRSALYPSAGALRKQWADPALRAEIIAKLEERGIDFDQLRTTSNQPEADPFDLLCHLAFNCPLADAARTSGSRL